MRHTLLFAQGLSLRKWANIRCAGVDWLIHTTLDSNSTFWCD